MNFVKLKKAIKFLFYSDRKKLLEALERSSQNHSIEEEEELEEAKFSKDAIASL